MNPKIETFETRPPKYEWICVGEYNGTDIPDIKVDFNYLVWQQLPMPEYDCEVIIQ